MALNISTSTAASRFFEYKVDQKKRSISKIGKIRFDLAEGLRSEEKKYATLPDCQSISLRKDLSIFLNVAVENISIFAGADEIIEMIPRLYLDVDKMALVIVPTFERMIATNYKAGGFVEPFSLKAENNFKISDEDIVEITTRANVIDARIIWVCTPNNPTGQVTSLDKISSIARKNPSRLIVVNEVYQEYFSCDSEKSAVTLVNDYANILVVRSFSKAFGLAGARIGYAVANKEMITTIERFKLLYCVSTPAQDLACVALAPASVKKMKNEIQKMKEEKVFLENFFSSSSQYEYIKNSETNFVLVRHKTKDIYNELYKAGVVVSDWRTAWGIRDMRFVRISINKADMNNKLKNILASIDNEGTGSSTEL